MDKVTNIFILVRQHMIYNKNSNTCKEQQIMPIHQTFRSSVSSLHLTRRSIIFQFFTKYYKKEDGFLAILSTFSWNFTILEFFHSTLLQPRAPFRQEESRSNKSGSSTRCLLDDSVDPYQPLTWSILIACCLCSLLLNHCQNKFITNLVVNNLKFVCLHK